MQVQISSSPENPREMIVIAIILS